MHLHFERTTNAKSDCTILSLTWMGKVPDELPEDEGWKLNRTNYYQEGWLATGNVRGIVGVTFTTSHCKKNVEFPTRTNYNLRGHRSEVILVKWNEPYQKLASCDSSGIIFVWIKYEGRWSIELINDRNTPVTYFSWSHDGRMALICYQDGFVLVGSVAGQRYWSSMLNLEATITCGIWTPDDQQVYFGTTSGQIIVMDVHGAMVSQVQLSSDVGITSMAWSCEKFKMEEGDDNDPGVANAAERKFVLAVCLQNGFVYLLKTFDDVSPVQIDTHLQGPLCMEWSNSREILAIAGTVKEDKGTNAQGTTTEYHSALKFFNEKGTLLYSTIIPFTQAPVSALTWGHNDKRIFLATGTQIHIAWVSRRIATLQLFCRLCIHNALRHECQLPQLPLPPRIRNTISGLFSQTIRSSVPEANALREFVSKPPSGSSVRLHCTMIRHDDETNLTSGTCYTLYLEYLGGLVPLLKGKKTSKIRPEFVIFDPQVEDFGVQILSPESKSSGSSNPSNNHSRMNSESSDSDREEGCAASPRMQRRRGKRSKSRGRSQNDKTAGQNSGDAEGEELAYVDTLPEHVRLVEVTSNIWGTKFKIHGLVDSVPANLGQVTYKTSLLHLQPRQMTLVMTELRDDFPKGPDPTFNPNIFSEDEEDLAHLEERLKMNKGVDNCPPIAPMSPRCSKLKRATSQLKTQLSETACSSPTAVLSKMESCEGESSSSSQPPPIHHEAIRPQCLNGPVTVQPRASGNVQSTSFMGQYGRSGSSNPPGQRHAVSPLCCEGSVPALQSPKNAVAPSDIIFDRPPAQTMITFSNTDYSFNTTNVQNIKADIIHSERARSGLHLNLTVNNSDQRKLFYLKKEQTGDDTGPDCAENDTNSKGPQKQLDQKDLSVHFRKNSLKNDEKLNDDIHPNTSSRSIAASVALSEAMVRSCSVGYLDMVDPHLVPNEVALQMLRKDAPKRLILVNQRTKQRKQSRKHLQDSKSNAMNASRLQNSRKSKSLDSTDIFPNRDPPNFKNMPSHQEVQECEPNITSPGSKAIKKGKEADPIESNDNPKREPTKRGFFSSKSPLARRKKNESDNIATADDVRSRGRSKYKHENYKMPSKGNANQITESSEGTSRGNFSFHSHALSTLENLITRLRDDDRLTPPNSPKLPRSSPSSPAPSKKGKRPQSSSPIRKHILSSPLLNRKYRKNKNLDSSDDEITASGDEICNGSNYKDLETFQKAQLRQKLKRAKIEPNGTNCNNQTTNQRREFVMHNKAPMWNENSQVYQLDFGGRVTQESAKNFQIEFRGKQVMQFGRIDGNAYTLDFQYPFSALQAFAVALANVTQRLK
ncbi:tubby-related protein 4 [Agrilus planipennis]|uniref:Tubby-related protein 4 n=1 Tax=Agrilus planipennis TaxID=224129 RepID=A0A1W4WQ77_AGRPL|nr:tubby-related protein 4 [Agrilus planipennis]